MPRSGYTGRTGPIGARGDSKTATATASSDPVTTAPTTPMSPSQMVIAGPAPSARKIAPSVSVAAHQAADHLTADHQRGERGDQPEHAEGDGLGPDGPLRLRHQRGIRLRPAGLPEGRRDLPDGRQHRRLVPRPAIELQGNVRVIGAARLQPPGQRRGEHRQLVTQSRVIVLHDLRVELNDADQPQRDHQVRLVRRIAGERRRVHLGGGEESHAQSRPDAQRPPRRRRPRT